MMLVTSDLIIYIDESIIAVNKPPGLRTIPDGYDPKIENLQSFLKNDFPELLTVHRLDKETSGVILFARNKKSHRDLNIQFAERKIQKKYWVITHNIPEWENYTAHLPLILNGDRNHRTLVKQSGKSSETHLIKHKFDQEKCLSFLEALPRTGYTHQIRTQLSFLGFPILGDNLYNKGLSKSQLQLNKSSDRMMLHATSIEFIHPNTNQKLLIQTETPFSLELV